MANKDLNTLYCADCGSSDVEMAMWVNPNTGENSGSVLIALKRKTVGARIVKNTSDYLHWKNFGTSFLKFL